MNVHQTSLHLDGNEPVTVDSTPVTDSIRIGLPLDQLSLVLSHSVMPERRVRFLTKLAEAASDLADEIVLRDLEAAS